MGSCCCSGSDPKPVDGRTRTQKPVQPHSDRPRFTDISINTKDPAKLIEGYEKQPLLTLEEALEPLDDDIDQLAPRIQDAKNRCNKSRKHKLTIDESAAIYVYTMKQGVYDELQAAFKRGDKEEMKKWLKYIKLFKNGLDKLPDAKAEVWQATHYDERTKQLLTSDEQPLFVGLGSCSPSDEDLKHHLGKDAAGRKIFIGYGLFIKAKDVTGYTANDYQELMLFPGAQLGKGNVFVNPDGSVYIHFTKKFGQ